MCVLDTRAGPIIIRASILDLFWLDSVRQGDMPGIRSASGNKLKVSRTINLHLRMCELLTRVNFGAVNKLVVPVLLRKTYINRFIKLMYPAKRKTVPHYSPPEPL